MGIIASCAALACAARQLEDDDGESPVEIEGWQGEPKWHLPPGGQFTVMMFGMTGAGKSSLGNLIAGKTIFKAGDDTRSMTNMGSVMKFAADDGSLTILDTIGLGDTEITEEQVVASIRDVALSAPSGVDMLLYVMRNVRITDDAISRLIYATQYLWGNECLLNLYVVVTCAPKYLQSRLEGEDWIQRQAELDWRFMHIFSLVGNNPNRFIFVDNPALDSGELGIPERRQLSSDAMFESFCYHPRDLVPPLTQAGMKMVKELVKEEQGLVEEQQKEVARLQDVIKKRPKKHHKHKNGTPKLGRSNTELDLDCSLREAKAKTQRAQEELHSKLEKVKVDKDFQKQVTQQVKRVSLRFDMEFRQAAKAKSTGLMSSLSRRFWGGGGQTPAEEIAASVRGLVAKSTEAAAKNVKIGKACIIFDWDDTLCPTHWIRAVMEPSLYHRDLDAHARKVEAVLRAAKEVADVDIVTLGNRQWLEQSMFYLGAGGLDLAAVLSELGIVIYYAQIPQKFYAGEDPQVIGKKIVMAELLGKRYGVSKTQWHALSIGDQQTEATALREVCKEYQRRSWRRPLCKTMKLPVNPHLEDLGVTLLQLTSQLQQIMARDKDCDVTLD
ncbi:unnamed protein product [Polarella glacialis]|uniref:AIG1-type G domain-containing protein n=1 Tax=Polarella glacialis TaxID=89957 RepID=A0A813FN91_POLGL|nr:unnamed protein product [Polarella glacialis]